MAVVNINPMKISGPWTEGFVLDYHSFSATPTGDPYHPFEMKYTELGGRLFRLKYRGEIVAVGDIIDTAEQFIRGWKPPVDCVVPTPPSLNRKAQPVVELARALGIRLNVAVCEDAVVKVKLTPPMKNVDDWYERQKILAEAIQVGPGLVKGKCILLLDDIVESGSTLRRTAEVLQKNGAAASLYALALTRKR